MASDGMVAKASRRAGFTLVEALVALVVAAMFLAVFGRAMAGAWSSTRAPIDVVAAVVLARDAAFGAPASTFAGARGQGFVIDRSSDPVNIDVRASRLAPPLVDGPDTSKDKSERRSTPSTMLLAEPKGIVQTAADAPQPMLRRIAVSVRTADGRRLRFDVIRLDNVSP